ncbi:MAG: hypothetical protein KatS3mg003_0116 [Candidatus Nitrosocaldaceae archaeon]|nr:MAG: hypothetical protein KatS3mg003_0116 [Candidatus Nitrosocaldaceae archaeon]
MRYGQSSNLPARDVGNYIRLGLLIGMGLILFSIISSQAVTFILNSTEFNIFFIKPVYYAMLAGLILAAIALIRVDIRKRESIVWWLVTIGISFLRREPITTESLRYKSYKLSTSNFVIWQITKVLIFSSLFADVMFGISASYFLQGNDLGVSYLPNILALPFILSPGSPADPSIAEENVIPMIPALTLLIPPLLVVIGIRILLYVGISNAAHIISSYLSDVNEGKPRYFYYISVLEMIIGVGLIWSAFNMFFTSMIDYNTPYAIIGTLLVGIVLLAWSFIDMRKAKVIILPTKKDIYIKALVIAAVVVSVGVLMAINTSIADARKIEYLGPYTAQQIEVNRYFADLDNVEERGYEVRLNAIPSSDINEFIEENKELLSKIRLWDWTAASAKITPEIGLIPYLKIYDSDILRFNGSLYWSASLMPILPSTVTPENRWFAEHFVYTHVPKGFLMLDAHNGTIVDSDEFFKQRRVYYGEGEGGLFDTTWSAFPVDRTTSDELDGYFYDGRGGITITPPLSWMFEPNFLLSYPTDAIHVMRYKNVNDRMELLYPYFIYHFGNRELDILPVTDGENTYWLMPLIARINTDYVPWGMGNDMFVLVGYALIDTYNGDHRIIMIGNDFFSKMFEEEYKDIVTREVPEWLTNQIRYPEELFFWKVNMYNIYHVTDISTFITAREFYEVPQGLTPYYIFAQPQGFEKPEFIGFISLELKAAAAKNLAGYMTVRNDYPNTGQLIFYRVPLESDTKLIGPSAVQEALDRDPDFAQLKTLLRNPRIGDNILYRIGNQDVYFIPIYTAGTGGVVAQLGTIAAVGAAFTGEYYVGLGDTVEDAFRAYLAKLAGIAPQEAMLNRDIKLDMIMSIINGSGLTVARPTLISAPITFVEEEVVFDNEEDFDNVKTAIESLIELAKANGVTRILIWEEEDKFNLGIIILVDNVPELHQVIIEMES